MRTNYGYCGLNIPNSTFSCLLLDIVLDNDIFRPNGEKKRRSQDSPHSPQILFVLFSFGLIKSINNGVNGLSVSKLGLLSLSWFISLSKRFRVLSITDQQTTNH